MEVRRSKRKRQNGKEVVREQKRLKDAVLLALKIIMI
jgi:hypothetical protein